MDLLTHAAYDKLLAAICGAGYRVVTVRQYLQGEREPLLLVLRHDVEWDVSRALTIAEIEKAHGIRSTMYFRVDTKAFDLSAMRYLQDEGFEIGYHFNTLDRCGGDFNRAIALFEKELQELREAGIKIDTVCSHGDPRVKKIGYKVNNEIFLKDPDLCKRSGLLGEAYLDIDFSSLQYFSDAGIKWNEDVSTKKLISRITQKEWPVIYMLTHPDYWSKSFLRALGVQVAARGMRRFKINKLIITGKQIVGFPQRFMRRKR
ncbi:hypothetical protein M1M94_01335 [Thermodesulfovibrionales bacterium]|nr:hypothetical protein [Thermodesulfovibrionales bacterium]